MKFKSIFKYVFMGAVIIIALQMIGINIPGLPGDEDEIDIRSALEILQSETVLLLVTDRISTNVSFSEDKTNIWIGGSETLALIHVRYLFGMDLEKLTVDSLEYRDSVLVVHLPEIEIIEIAPDLGSLEVMHRESGLRWVGSQLSGRNETEELLDNLDVIVEEYAYEEDLIPARSEILFRLNGYAPTLAEQIGTEVIFK